MFQNLPLPATQEVRASSSSSVTSCIVMMNGGVLYNQILHAVAENILVYYDIVSLQFWSRNVACTIPIKVNVLHTAVDWQSSPPKKKAVRREQVRTEKSRGKCTCSTPNSFSITGTVLMWYVSVVCSGRIVYIYFVKMLRMSSGKRMDWWRRYWNVS